MFKRNWCIWFSFILILMLAGCGYRFTGSGSFPDGVNHVFVEVLENQSSESGIENTVTSSMVNEFTLREKETFVGDINEADAILSGTVSRIAFHTISAKGKDSARERRVTVVVNLKLTDKEGGSVLWAANGLSDNEAYEVVDDKNTTERNKRVAIGRASRRIAERALNRLTDDF